MGKLYNPGYLEKPTSSRLFLGMLTVHISSCFQSSILYTLSSYWTLFTVETDLPLRTIIVGTTSLISIGFFWPSTQLYQKFPGRPALPVFVHLLVTLFTHGWVEASVKLKQPDSCLTWSQLFSSSIHFLIQLGPIVRSWLINILIFYRFVHLFIFGIEQ